MKIKRFIRDALTDEIRQSLETLKEREKQVIKMYFGIDRDYALTLNEIGDEFSLTQERVRQIKEKAIRRLRHRSRSKAFFNNNDHRRNFEQWLLSFGLDCFIENPTMTSDFELQHIGIG